jgi:sarcosine oxidase/L-pipecolate oxidase
LKDVLRARSNGWGAKIDPLDKKARLGYNIAVLDSTAGFVAAYKACHWAWHLCSRAGVRFVQDVVKGKVVSLVQEGSRVAGIRTADGLEHRADMVIVAGGGWTPTLIPEVRDLLETTAGSIATITLDKNTMPSLWDKYAPDNMPVLTWGMKEGKGVYMLPRTENGVVKFG